MNLMRIHEQARSRSRNNWFWSDEKCPTSLPWNLRSNYEQKNWFVFFFFSYFSKWQFHSLPFAKKNASTQACIGNLSTIKGSWKMWSNLSLRFNSALENFYNFFFVPHNKFELTERAIYINTRASVTYPKVIAVHKSKTLHDNSMINRLSSAKLLQRSYPRE